MQHRQAGKPHFAACIHAEFLNFLRIRKTKAENQSQPEASGTWLWFVFGYFGCFMALPVQANIGKGLLQIFVLLQQPRGFGMPYPARGVRVRPGRRKAASGDDAP